MPGKLLGLIFFSQYLTNLMHKICFHNMFYFMPLHVSSKCAHHQEVKIALHSLSYHHTYRWPSRAQGLCIKLVKYWDKFTEMHGQQNVKLLGLNYIDIPKNTYIGSWAVTEIMASNFKEWVLLITKYIFIGRGVPSSCIVNTFTWYLIIIWVTYERELTKQISP